MFLHPLVKQPSRCLMSTGNSSGKASRQFIPGKLDMMRCEMASGKEYLEFILEQLSGLEDVSYKAMMGEYIIYYRGKIIGGIYDDRFLVKPVSAARRFMPDAAFALPYDGAKEMLLVDNVDSKDFLRELIGSIYDELPMPTGKRRHSGLQR